ncbi:calcium/sodium antiporter [Actinomarinicola tropica]|uniref:Calcium/sodium antiporter n=1 Tax=Actinomarinicola tropica TaxID=2789776 RepID=A0A5Q2RDG5_9ACTN|nr:calcium/sodium antiporter [Actinomarinicola tropica]QGG94908.1 calcium/sodium antiporter [Actinomarinicola tropica]
MLVLHILFVVVGLVVLTKAADQFVLGAARISLALRISAVVVGAVIVGFGTSAPEMLVSTLAALDGNAEVGLGNIVGSNVANLTLVLGAAALIVRVGIHDGVLRREAPLMLGAVALFALLVQDGVAGWEAAVLLVVMVAVLTIIIRSGGLPDPELEEEVEEFADEAHPHPLKGEVVRTVIGLLGTLLGAQLLVTGAVEVADAAGLSGGFVGFTLVAVGTSLPELVTTVAAARAGETDLIVGNLLGSNIFNSLIVGATMGFASGGLDAPKLLGIGVVMMVAIAGGLVVLMLARRQLTRIEGGGLILAYGASVALLGV